MKIPAPYMQNAFDIWVNHGTPHPDEMGSFMRAVLSHDLMAAAQFADDVNRPALADWAFYMHNEMPSGSHGTGADLNAWYEKGGRSGHLRVAADVVPEVA